MPPRRLYLDWMRGLAVLIMIEAHVVDSWTRLSDRDSPGFSLAIVLGGMGAPLFLFLAGVSVALSAGSKLRRTGDSRRASRKVLLRGLEIFGLAFLFRLQAWVLGWGPPSTLLRVDVLNIMGPSIIGAAALWGAMRTARGRLAAFVVATLAIAFSTPLVRLWEVLSSLPDPIEAYFRPSGGYSVFVLFPWSGFVAAGAALGVLLDESGKAEQERRLNRRLGVAGATVAVISYALSHLPSAFQSSYFWTTSPAFFFLRSGLMMLAVAFAYAWLARRDEARRSALVQLGRTSLFVYWIHVEMVYGLVSRPLHKALPLGAVWLAYGLFVVFMLGCSVAKDRAVTRWRSRRTGGSDPVASV